MKTAHKTASDKPRLTTSAMIALIAAEGQKTKPRPSGTLWS
jgi:hypothetical protein